MLADIDDHSRFVVIAAVLPCRPAGPSPTSYRGDAGARVPAEVLTDNGKQVTGSPRAARRSRSLRSVVQWVMARVALRLVSPAL